MRDHLEWGGIGYKRFQQLSIPLASYFYPGRKFKEHLKSGQRQDGIDLKSFELEGQTQIYIQCKNEKDFNTESKLKEAIEEFTNGKFCVPGVSFTILTSADQRKQKFQETVEAKKIWFKQDYGVTFECWDVNDLEEELRNRWRLVHKFFSRNEAEDFCSARFDLDIVERLKPVLNMMPRYLVERPTSKKDQKPSLHELFWSATSAPKVDLVSKLTKKSNIHQYCILGDPYHGKSTYLKHAAYELANGKGELLPILIELKNATIQSIEKILDDTLGPGWREKANDDLVILLDAADEVRDDSITEMTKFIRSFTQSYPDTKIVVSCRTRHFKDFKIDEILSHFEILELAPLESKEIHEYLRSQLGQKVKKFMDQATRSGLHPWLYHPFYLRTLIEEFSHSECLPPSPLEAIKKFLERAYEKSYSRQLAGGVFLDHKFAQFQRVVNNFAMVLQMTGKNSMSLLDLDSVFSTDAEKELLRNNPLISELNGQYSFTNSFLQEHLAASVLAKMDFNKITKLVWKDRTNKKIKTKWIQTLSSAISLLPATDPTRLQIVDLMEQDSPELIFETESTAYPDQSFKLEALKKLLNYMLTNNMWPLMVRPEKIGRFMDGTPGAARFLIDLFQNDTTPTDKKDFCCRVLQSISLSNKEKGEILAIALNYLKKAEDKGVAYELLRILAVHGIGNSSNVATVIADPYNNSDHFFRCRVYEWICKLNLTDEYWSYAVDGLSIWVDANTKQSHGGSDIPLVDFLLELSSFEQAKSLFEALGTPKLLKFSKIPGPPNNPFFTALFDRCAEILRNDGKNADARILIPISRFLKQTRLTYQHENYPEIDHFLETTETRNAVAMLLMDDIMVEDRWTPGPIVPEELFDIYLAIFDDKELNSTALTNVAYAIYPGDAGNLKREFALRANAATGQYLLPVWDDVENNKYWQAQRKLAENNLHTIQTRKKFQSAIRRYFKLRGKPLKNIHELFESLDEESPLYTARTPLIQEFLRRFFDNGIAPTLKISLENLQDDDKFEHFRATELMQSMPSQPDLNKQALEIIRSYYYKKLPDCKFENTYWSSPSGFRRKPLEDLIGSIFQKFTFPTLGEYLPELLWLDKFGVRAPELIYNKTESSIHQKIEQQLGDKANSIIGKAVIEHIKKGIQLETILFAHFSIAARLKLTDALPFLLDALNGKKMDSGHTEDLCKFYVLAGGDKENLLPVFRISSPEDYYYLHLVRELGPVCYEEVKATCLRHLSDPNIDDKRKAYIARELVTLGSLEGLNFLSTYLKANTETVAMMQLSFQVARLDTSAALKILFSIADILVDPTYDVDRPPSARHVLRDWLDAISQKSEQDLNLVKEFFEKADKEIKAKFPGPSELKWNAIRILDNSRKSTDEGMDIHQAKKMLRDLESVD